MTIIAALHDPERGETWIGSDTIAVCHGIRSEIGPKWALHCEWAVGLSGEARVLNLVRERRGDLMAGLKGPEHFTQRFRDLLKAEEFDLKPGEGYAGPTSCQWGLLVRPGEIWHVAGDFSFVRMEPYWAEGSGFRLALGALRTLVNGFDLPPRRIIGAAVEAAVHFDTDCGGEVWLHKLEPAA